MAQVLIGQRLKALREERHLTQDDLAQMFGFNDRQTVSAIEKGDRKLSAVELLTAVRALSVELDYFTDPFRLVSGEGRFNWRQSGVLSPRLDAYETIAGRLIAAYRVLRDDVGEKPALMRATLTLSKNPRFEDAEAAGERFAAEYDLGEAPALRLAEAMESRLSVLVLMVDPNDDGISGAACRLTDLDVVLINRNEVPGRRHFDLAHELFHVLTWEAMPPERTEDTSETAKRSRVEQLADCFAGGLLMPRRIVEAAADWKAIGANALPATLNGTAERLGVTSVALKWRLVSLGLLGKATAELVPGDALRNNGRIGGLFAEDAQREFPPLFSRRFVEIVARAIDEGRVSTRKVASLLGVAVDDLDPLFAQHGVPAPYEI